MELQEIDLGYLIESETGDKFNRKGYISCPFHSEKTPSLSIKFFPNANKYKFKCFGCGEAGDALDFIMKFKGLGYREAREYLGMEAQKSEQELQEEKVKGYIDWEIKNTEHRRDKLLLGLFPFTNERNEIVYFKAKFKDKEGKKSLSYYHIDGNDKVINRRNGEELPYNLYRTIKAIKEGKVIVICEGEKDVNSLNSIFKGQAYEAVSVKGVKDLKVFRNADRLFICGDTGKAGEEYKRHIKSQLFSSAEEFRFINLPGLEDLGDNKDVTDWLETGHTFKELMAAFNRSLDLKNKYELQQDSFGIYKYITKGKGEETETIKVYLTNFNLIEATRIRFVDEDHEGVKLIVRSSTGEIIEKLGEAEVFDDTKSFKNFLGTLDLAFKGKVDELTDLKTWINKYFALQSEEIYKGIKFGERNGELMFVTNDGALSKNGVNKSIRSDKRNDIDILDIEPITKEELRNLKKHIFRFASPDKSISIIGGIINNLAVYQNEKTKQKLHHLLIVGESGSGKSTILEHVIAPILNYPRKDIKSIGLITPFALINDLSNGNYPMLFDEFKPSGLDKYKVAKLSETFRNLYDRATISRGDKTLKSRDFHLNRPIVLVGEESYPNQEKALIERSCIVYLSKRERTEVHSRTMRWIIDNEKLMNKLGRALIDIILNLSVEDYMQIRNSVISTIKGLSNRPLNTAVNTCCGIEIFNLLLKQHKLSLVTKYAEHITDNIKNEVLGNEEDAHSTVEQMLILYNEMIEDGRALNVNDVIRYSRDGIFIKTSEMINQIREHVNKVGADIIPLRLKDFKKQASKSGYLEVISNKVIRLGMKTVRYDTYNRELLRKLKLYSIVPPEIVDITDERVDTIPFD